MELEHLLGEQSCTCGKTHHCDIKYIRIGYGILDCLPEITAPYHNILVIADKNTFATCGTTVEEKLGASREGTLVFSDDLLIPNEQAVDAANARLTDKTDLIVGIGSGVIQDLCKYVAFYKGIRYHIIATAPSMDGYASSGAAMILGGMKVTASCRVPEAIIADVDVLKDAPMDMIQAGYGDILGKYSCLNDWKLNHIIHGEYFCQSVHDLMFDMLLSVKDLGPQLLQREPEAVKLLMEALAGAGIAMALVGNSRPASGSEHHLSHYFEITGILHGESYFPHGIDVVYSAVLTQQMRDQLLAMGKPTAIVPIAPEAREADLRRIYASAADGVIALQARMGWYEEDRMPIYQEKWDEICAVLSQSPSAQQMLAYIESVGLDMAEYYRLYTPQKLADGKLYAKDLKDRFTVLWLYYDLLAS